VTFDDPPATGSLSDDWTDVLQRWLPTVIPPERVALVGSWSRPMRRQYKSPAQLGSGTGPYVNIIDAIWRGTTECRVPVVGIAFLQTADGVYWAKSAPAALAQPIDICIRGYANYAPEYAMLSCGLGDGGLPGIQLRASSDLRECCRMGLGETTTGVPYQVCETDAGRFFIVLVQQALARTGRCRLWRLRRRAALLLPVATRELLTQRRRGSWRCSAQIASHRTEAWLGR
jgi:hypothetical protein